MPIQERSPRLVHTSTLNEDVHQLRRHLRRLGGASLVLSVWLAVSLALCSIHPELSTRYTHPLGAVSQFVSSGLLEHFGLVSFSACLLLTRLGWMLLRLQVPVLTSFDLVSYAMINVVCTFPLAVFFKGATLFGAPYGGAVGERFLSLFAGTVSPYLELCSASALLCSVLFYLQLSTSYGASKGAHPSASGGAGRGGEGYDQSAREVGSEHSGKREEAAPRQARSVELLSAKSVRSAPSEILARLHSELEAEDEGFEEMSALDEPVDESLFKLSPEPVPAQAQREPSPVSYSSLYSADASTSTVTSSASVGLLTPASHEPAIYQAHMLQAGRSASHHRPLIDIERADAPHRDERLAGGILRDPFQRHGSSADRPLSAHLSPEPKSSSQADLSHRKSFILRAFEQVGLEVRSLQAEVGEVTSAFSVSLKRSLRVEGSSIELLNDRLNQLVKKSYGRTEPSLLVLPSMKGAPDGADLQVTWPHRAPRFTPNKRGIEENRARRRAGNPLMLYLGDLPNGCDVYLPFKDIPSLLVTGGEKTSKHLGVSLLVMSLIYQARESELRFLIAEPSMSKRPEPSPFHEHPQLFAPVLYQNAQVTRSLSWLLSELSARSYLMKKAQLDKFEDLSARSKAPMHRLVMVVSELNQLNDEALMLLAQLLDRLERTAQDVGVHVLVNARGVPQTQLTQRVMRSCARRLSLSAKSAEAKQLGCVASANLIPQQQDMVLDIGTGPVRVHGWLLSPKAYVTFLNMIASSNQPSYVCPDGRFDALPVPAIHGRSRAGSVAKRAKV